jgi:hypothetical protein
MFTFSLPPDACIAKNERPSLELAWLSVRLRFCATVVGLHKTESTYALVEVDRVFAGDDIGDGAASGLAGSLLCGWGHFYKEVMSANVLGEDAISFFRLSHSWEISIAAIVVRSESGDRVSTGCTY